MEVDQQGLMGSHLQFCIGRIVAGTRTGKVGDQ